MSCSRRGPLRYVCGQAIDPTAMICTFLESPTDLDVHPRKSFALLAKIVKIDVAEVGTQNNEICSCGPDRRGSSPVHDNFFGSFFNILVCNALFFSSRAQISRNWPKLTYKTCKISRLSLLVSRRWSGPLRHVYGYTNHSTTLVHTFLESLVI